MKLHSSKVERAIDWAFVYFMVVTTTVLGALTVTGLVIMWREILK